VTEILTYKTNNMAPSTNRIIRQFARVGTIFSRPIIRSKYSKLLLVDEEFTVSSVLKR